MSKLVVVLLPGGMPEYLTVDDNQTTITWYKTPEVAGNTGRVLPIETYLCEGEEFHFARVETPIEGDVVKSISYLTAQKPGSLVGLMSSLRNTFSVLLQFSHLNNLKRIRAK
jgi:hypothetical protein